MRQKTIYGSLILAAIISLSFSFNKNTMIPGYHNLSTLNPFGNGSPTGKTGAPFEGSCVDCHQGSTLPAAGVVTFSFSGANDLYLPNQSYDVTISKVGATKAGFQMTALDANNAAAGDFTSGTNSQTQSQVGREYINHSASQGVDSWTFQWNSPSSSMGDVTFYYAFNESNNNGNNQGDQIYLGSTTISADSGVSVSEENYDIDFYQEGNNLMASFYLSESSNIYFAAQDLTGKQLDYHNFGMVNSGVQSMVIPLNSNYPSGIYLFTIFVNNKPITKKVALP